MQLKIYNNKNSSSVLCNYCGSIEILFNEYKACHRCALQDNNILIGRYVAKKKYGLTKQIIDKIDSQAFKFKGKIPMLYAKTLSEVVTSNKLDSITKKEIQILFKKKLEENKANIQKKIDSIKEYLIDLSCKIDGSELIDIKNDRWLHNEIFICVSNDNISYLDAVYKSLSVLNEEINREKLKNKLK